MPETSDGAGVLGGLGQGALAHAQQQQQMRAIDAQRGAAPIVSMGSYGNHFMAQHAGIPGAYLPVPETEDARLTLRQRLIRMPGREAIPLMLADARRRLCPPMETREADRAHREAARNCVERVRGKLWASNVSV